MGTSYHRFSHVLWWKSCSRKYHTPVLSTALDLEDMSQCRSAGGESEAKRATTGLKAELS